MSGEKGDLEGPPCPGLMLMSGGLALPGPEDALPPSSDKAERYGVMGVMGAKPEHPRLHSRVKAGCEETPEACIHETSSPRPIFPADGKRLY